uniref:Uncharacterized protein n=1 Tax=Candidatus Kentrum sp. TC TaxID=2126339 RepID=A0A450Z0J1_9GAMM|nr:MAG: hypothetical protein BECKTC1821E_GA0114239_10829 [Candidatus Kentron sp. TC]
MEEHVSASRQDPNGGFLARALVFSEFLFFRNLKETKRDYRVKKSIPDFFTREIGETRFSDSFDLQSRSLTASRSS